MTDTDLPENSVGAVIDKGLFDALLCTATGSITVAQYINEVSIRSSQRAPSMSYDGHALYGIGGENSH